jgi:hypothetical protein
MTEGTEQSKGSGGEVVRKRYRHRRRHRRGRRRLYQRLRKGTLLIAAALLMALYCTWNDAGWTALEGVQEARSVTPLCRSHDTGIDPGRGDETVFGPSTGEAPLPDGFGPTPSPLPYLVLGLPVLWCLEMLRRKVHHGTAE